MARRERRTRALRRLGIAFGLVAVAVAAAVGIARMDRPAADAARDVRAPVSAAPEPRAGPGEAGGGAVVAPPPIEVAPAPTAGNPPAVMASAARAPVDPQRAVPPPRKPVSPIPLTVHVRPYAQRALLDGVEVPAGQQRIVFALVPGSHRIRVEHPCCEPYEREVDASEAEGLGELKVPLSPRPASLVVTGDPATLVFLDGKLLGTAGDSQREPFRVRIPTDSPSPYEGEGDLRLEAPGRRAASATVRIRAGQEITVPAIQAEEPRR